jgi:hypothetical protein
MPRAFLRPHVMVLAGPRLAGFFRAPRGKETSSGSVATSP